MTEEKNINATAEQDKFADEILSDDELDNVAGGTVGKFKLFAPKESEENTTFNPFNNHFKPIIFMCTGK